MGMCICREYGERDVELRYNVYTLRRKEKGRNHWKLNFDALKAPMRSTERREAPYGDESTLLWTKRKLEYIFEVGHLKR